MNCLLSFPWGPRHDALAIDLAASITSLLAFDWETSDLHVSTLRVSVNMYRGCSLRGCSRSNSDEYLKSGTNLSEIEGNSLRHMRESAFASWAFRYLNHRLHPGFPEIGCGCWSLVSGHLEELRVSQRRASDRTVGEFPQAMACRAPWSMSVPELDAIAQNA